MARLILFRFLCTYITFFIFNPFYMLCPWVATHIFHITGQAATHFRTGSGDTTLAFINVLLSFLAAIAVMILWSVLDRRRTSYDTLHGWLRVLVRFYLASILFGYGFAKVFPQQFRPNDLYRMIEPYGDFSPMGVVWAFMGASQPYVVFSGFAEVIPALLLLFRRTTTLGAMSAFAVMLNVVAINYCYDVPVKLFSTHLLLLTVFLAAPDAKRLINLFVLNRATDPYDDSHPRFESRWLQISTKAIWGLFVVASLCGHIWSGWQNVTKPVIRSPLYGVYQVESGAATAWHKVAIQDPERFTVRMTDSSVIWFNTEYDTAKSTVVLNNQSSMIWSRPDATHLTLTGNLFGDQVVIKLRKFDDEILLLNRGFHWINEYPMNR